MTASLRGVRIRNEATQGVVADEFAACGLESAFSQVGPQRLQLGLALFKRTQTIADHLTGGSVATARDFVADEYFPVFSKTRAPGVRLVVARGESLRYSCL
jgi:hypothetical protein